MDTIYQPFDRHVAGHDFFIRISTYIAAHTRFARPLSQPRVFRLGVTKVTLAKSQEQVAKQQSICPGQAKTDIVDRTARYIVIAKRPATVEHIGVPTAAPYNAVQACTRTCRIRLVI